MTTLQQRSTSSVLKIHVVALQMALAKLQRQGADTDFLELIVKQLEQYQQTL